MVSRGSGGVTNARGQGKGFLKCPEGSQPCRYPRENIPGIRNSCYEGLKRTQVACSGIMECSSPLNLDGRSSRRQSHRELGQAVPDRQRLA